MFLKIKSNFYLNVNPTKTEKISHGIVKCIRIQMRLKKVLIPLLISAHWKVRNEQIYVNWIYIVIQF